MKLSKQINKVDKKMQELNDYLSLFNSPFAPRGEGARQEACREFHEFMKSLHKALENLEEAQLNAFDWTVETIELID
jgi:DNA anti-recombination protein RmuC